MEDWSRSVGMFVPVLRIYTDVRLTVNIKQRRPLRNEWRLEYHGWQVMLCAADGVGVRPKLHRAYVLERWKKGGVRISLPLISCLQAHL